MGGRPGGRRERQVQKRRKAERCQATTVAGFTSPGALRQQQGAEDRSVVLKFRSLDGTFQGDKYLMSILLPDFFFTSRRRTTSSSLAPSVRNC